MPSDPYKHARFYEPGPGKFEGEGPETSWFYEAMLDGDGEAVCLYPPADVENGPHEDDCEPYAEATLFIADYAEIEAFKLEHDVILLWEDSQGFAYARAYPSRNAAEAAFDEWAC